MPDTIEIPRAEYVALKAAREDLEDILAGQEFDRSLAMGEEERLPSALVKALVAGENKLKLWRNHRGLTQLALSELSGVARPMIAEIERGAKTGSVDSLKAIADSLNIQIDDLV